MKCVRRWALRRTTTKLLARAKKSPNGFATIEASYFARRNLDGYRTDDVPHMVALLTQEQTESVKVEQVLVVNDETFGLQCKYLLLSANV